jgi:hypothetical protein
MNVEVADTFETLETSYQNTRFYIPEDSQLHDYGFIIQDIIKAGNLLNYSSSSYRNSM